VDGPRAGCPGLEQGRNIVRLAGLKTLAGRSGGATPSVAHERSRARKLLEDSTRVASRTLTEITDGVRQTLG
jgi:hypothetical protein